MQICAMTIQILMVSLCITLLFHAFNKLMLQLDQIKGQCIITNHWDHFFDDKTIWAHSISYYYNKYGWAPTRPTCKTDLTHMIFCGLNWVGKIYGLSLVVKVSILNVPKLIENSIKYMGCLRIWLG